MDYLKGFTAGYIQEEMAYSAISSLPSLRVIPNLKLFSFKLRKETEIDLIVITKVRIYSVEVKSYKSSLEGRYNERTWKGRSGKYTKSIFNPVFQNFEHVRTIRNNLRRNNLPVYDIQNIVLVPNKCKIISDCNNIYKIRDFLRLLMDESDSSIEVNDIDAVYSLIRNLGVI